MNGFSSNANSCSAIGTSYASESRTADEHAALGPDPVFHKAANVLERAADLIEPEGRWIQGHYACDANGEPTSYEEGTSWCAEGAIYRTNGRFVPIEVVQAIFCQALEITDNDIIDWNDASGRAQTEVVEALRKAACLARKLSMTRA